MSYEAKGLVSVGTIGMAYRAVVVATADGATAVTDTMAVAVAR